MRRSRSTHRPLFDVMRPAGNVWTWEVTYKVASSGYVNSALVLARRRDPDGDLVGTAYCDVQYGDDLHEVLEFLAVESMLVAVQPSLWDAAPTKRCIFVSSEL